MADEDWRLQVPHAHLTGLVLRHRRWTQTRPHWDHDHCEFCGVTFGDERLPDALHNGWTNANEYWWICDGCFSDFLERFGWSVGQPSSMAEDAERFLRIRPFLVGLALRHRGYEPREGWSFDLCEFCGVKIGPPGEGVFDSGWTDEEGLHRICTGCFGAYGTVFGWSKVS